MPEVVAVLVSDREEVAVDVRVAVPDVDAVFVSDRVEDEVDVRDDVPETVLVEVLVLDSVDV